MPWKSRTWEGLTLVERMNRAAGRSIVAIGMNVAIETKRVTHVQTGNLRRSTHAAPVEADHGDDDSASETTDLLLQQHNLKASDVPVGKAVEVGSWLPYACVEWVGRSHPGVQQGLEAVRGHKADLIVATAFKEEGL